jgi:hypothetical protein
MLHKDWQKSPEGQRVMFQSWLMAVEGAACWGKVKLSERRGGWLAVMPHTVVTGWRTLGRPVD